MKNLWAAIAMISGLGALTAHSQDAKIPSGWEFDRLPANVNVKGEPIDPLSSAALAQLGLTLEGKVTVRISASANTVGGVTLRIEDPSDPAVVCEVYATREGERLTFKDSRCSFPALTGNLRTTATCRKISGSARRLKAAVAFEASSPDCTAQPMGLPLTVRATVTSR
jgi:hypothetical protein